MASSALPPAAAAMLNTLSAGRKKNDPSFLRFKRAMELACELYEDKQHWSKTSIFKHSLGVLTVSRGFDPDDELIVAAILHHVMEHGGWTPKQVEAEFGPTVRSIIHGAYLLSKVTTENRRVSMEHLRTILLKVSNDVRVILFLLCHQLEVLQRLELLDDDVRKRLCRDTLQLYAPVAARLGIYALKQDLESKAFPVMYPVDSVRIAEQLNQMHEEYGEFLEPAERALQKILRKEGIHCTVEAREKQPFSIFRKMHLKNISHVRDLYDLCALRVIVQEEAQCYQVLGVLHRIGHPVQNRFKDYIAFPKPNGYRSVHTTLLQLPGVPEGVSVEVQIRTAAMHREADFGLASHWSYKQGQKEAQTGRISRLRQALSASPLEERFADTNATSDQIFVLTPKGDIIELPDGSTPLDFAFNVHTQVGLSFKAARVNGSIVPLNHPLENGDIVEIVRHNEPHPSPRWLQLLKTASAKSRLKRFLAVQERPTFLLLGREAMNQELLRRHLPPLDTDLTILRGKGIFALTIAQREDLLVEVGEGHESALAVLQRIGVVPEEATSQHHKPAFTESAVIKVDGSIPLPTCFAKCCKPDVGEHGAVVGVIGRGGEVRIHRGNCKLIRGANRERVIGASWVQAGKALTARRAKGR